MEVEELSTPVKSQGDSKLDVAETKNGSSFVNQGQAKGEPPAVLPASESKEPSLNSSAPSPSQHKASEDKGIGMEDKEVATILEMAESKLPARTKHVDGAELVQRSEAETKKARDKLLLVDEHGNPLPEECVGGGVHTSG